MNILRIDSSARFEQSLTRQLADALMTGLREQHPDLDITHRELSRGLPLLSEDWVNANFTDPAERSAEQGETLSLSDTLVAELKAADMIVLAAPVYNFSIPATLKSWIDHIARARETFSYTENGPEGLLHDRPVYVLMASGGTPIGSAMDFASGYLRHILGFVGLTRVQFIAAEQLMSEGENAVRAARDDILQALQGNPATALGESQ